MSDLVLSQSAIDTFDRCARRFYLRYVRGLDWPAPLTSTELEFEQAMRRGEHFHLLIQQHALGMEVTPMVEASGDPVLRGWWDSFLHTALTMMPENLQADFTEVELATDLDGVTLVAKFDRLTVEGSGVLRIFDWKTGLPGSRERLAQTWQSVVYRFVAAERGAQLLAGAEEVEIQPESVELIYWHAREPATPVRLPYDTGAHEQGRARLAKIVGEMASLMNAGDEEVFGRTPDEAECRHCPFRSYCERGREAAPIMDPESMPEGEELMRLGDADGITDPEN
ncbi:MAG: PD-(D/E)XK nuclease family protein [Gemmatimonadetes bacterium]|nr:PD-(D/E)XK nuclease family protein [Gemmatimonadota bacterium]MBT7860079.1 PD-(D/E)XK nuclease family protein [Gemmatimonadota bacterium]